MRKLISSITVFLLGGILLTTFFTMPEGAKELSDYYISSGVVDTGAINLITAILFDYRGFDTLGEATVIFAAACTLAFLVPKQKVHMLSARFSVIVQQSISFILPFLFVIGMYLIFYGHLSPGGGFTGGVVLASIVILTTITFGISYSDRQVRPRVKSLLESFGAIGFVIFGLFGIFAGGAFLANGQAGFDLGIPGELTSSGLIPYINFMTGLKVAAGLSIMFTSLIKEE
ncbi:hydrogen gas-evolving membrane-bound hydrogenase subunit E [Halonatronum saccharophilum]|uniref:hydrogen gas-evolving membrane-bound hydrogenase subunit E n=1 Tax=Halonatronum saccharophilum TaxID=150060 RepID=UPI0004862D1C|nr:hydrogen gas-evolving membrane-bound hydrogenase subunit E [Halonatronum saccharophilum]